MEWLLAIAIFAIAAGCTHAPGDVSAEGNRRDHAVQIKFARSGGMGGLPGLNVEGVVDLDDHGAHVTSAGSQYRRDLAPHEAQTLRSSADLANVSRARTSLAARPSRLRDAYQYDIAVTSREGRTEHVTLNAAGGSGLNEVAPGLGDLVQWIDDEAQKIKEQRLKSR